MADLKTSQESNASALDGTELVRVVQGGGSAKTTAQAIANLIKTALANIANGFGADLVGGAGRTVNSIAAIRSLSKTGAGRATALGHGTPGDGGEGPFYFDSSDTTSGCFFTGSITGTVLTVSAVTNGTIAIGQAVARSDTGATIAWVESLGTGTGGTGTYNLNTSLSITSMVMMADNNGTITVAFDGGRWKRPLGGWVSVKQFGAKLDYNGTTGTDDWFPIQSCITWVSANTNTSTYGSYSPSVGTGVVYFPQGSGMVTRALVITDKICIQGEGQTEFSYGSRLTQTVANQDLFQIAPSGGSTSFSIEKMVLRSDVLGSGNTGHLVNMVRSGGGTVNSQRYKDVTFSQPQAMALYLAGDDIVIDNCLGDVSQQSGDFIQLGTSTMPATDVRITGGDWFNATHSVIKLVNFDGVSIGGGLTMTQPNPTTKTPYFIDGQTTTPTLAKNLTVSGVTIRGARTCIGIENIVNMTFGASTISECGIGSGETFHMFQFGGTCVNVNLGNMALSGSYDTANFYNDFNCSSITGTISGLSLHNDGGSGDALSCTKHVGRILSNFYSGFVNQQMGEKRATSGGAVNPGTLTAMGTGGAVFGYEIPVTGANYGDTVNFGTITNAWACGADGVDVRAYVNTPGYARIEYRNTTASSITVPTHDLWEETTR